MIAYFNGRFIPKEDVKISPDDRGFLFADGAYEVIRSYGGRLFKIEEHLERLKRSLSELLISEPSLINLRNVAEHLIHRNNLGNSDATLYIQVTQLLESMNFQIKRFLPPYMFLLHLFCHNWINGRMGLTLF